MKSRTLIQLFLVNFVILLTGMGLLPLLPIYAQRFGANATSAGLYLAIAYASITAGTLLTNRLGGWIGHRRLFVGAGSLGVPALILLGQAAQFWQVEILTAVIWFSGGIGIASSTIFIGLLADQGSRGKSFGVMFLSSPLASLVAGLTVGELVEWRGYPFMFTALALVWAIWPLMAIAGLGRRLLSRPVARRDRGALGRKPLTRAFTLLLAATLLSATTIYLLRFGTSYAMQNMGFSPSAISSTSAAGGLVTIPLAFALGSLSDRFGRKGFLIGGYVLGGMAAIVLINAAQVWHFWLATAFAYMALSAIGSVGPALAVDLLPLKMRGHGLPYFNAMRNIAGIIGYASGGLLLDVGGAYSLFIIAAILPVVAIMLISQVRATPAGVASKSEIEAELPRGKHDSAATFPNRQLAENSSGA